MALPKSITAYGKIRYTLNGIDSLDGRKLYIVIGPNGIGKSSFFKLLVGLSPGLPEDVEPYRFLYHAQEEYLFRGSVRSNLGILAKGNIGDMLESVKVHGDMDKILSDGIDHVKELLDEDVGLLSGGQRQIVTLGRTMLSYLTSIGHKWQGVVLDEPTKQLSPGKIAFLNSFVKYALTKRALPIIVISHDFFFVEQMFVNAALTNCSIELIELKAIDDSSIGYKEVSISSLGTLDLERGGKDGVLTSWDDMILRSEYLKAMFGLGAWGYDSRMGERGDDVAGYFTAVPSYGGLLRWIKHANG